MISGKFCDLSLLHWVLSTVQGCIEMREGVRGGWPVREKKFNAPQLQNIKISVVAILVDPNNATQGSGTQGIHLEQFQFNQGGTCTKTVRSRRI